MNIINNDIVFYPTINPDGTTNIKCSTIVLMRRYGTVASISDYMGEDAHFIDIVNFIIQSYGLTAAQLIFKNLKQLYDLIFKNNKFYI